MIMKARRAGTFLRGCFCAWAVWGLLLSASGPAPSSQSASPTPQWWKVTLSLKTSGRYQLDQSGSSFAGHYAFVVRWTGFMEKDDNDYLLYRIDCRLDDWQAEETASSPQVNGVLTTNDFKEKPEFILKYILRQGTELHLDFVTAGIIVPQNVCEDTFPLLFPSSEQNAQHESDVDYNAGLSKGSNRIALEEAQIYTGPVSKTYSWSWKHVQWLMKQQRTVFTSQSHDVEVFLAIIPHYTRPKAG
jgi:hypothetical protein